jgi:hypothetical protein
MIDRIVEFKNILKDLKDWVKKGGNRQKTIRHRNKTVREGRRLWKREVLTDSINLGDFWLAAKKVLLWQNKNIATMEMYMSMLMFWGSLQIKEIETP